MNHRTPNVAEDRISPGTVLVIGLGLYLTAATGALLVLRPALLALLAVPSRPEVLAMSRGLQGLLVVFLYVPSMACVLTTVTIWLFARERRSDRALLLWLFAGFLPFAVEHVGTALVVFLRERPATPGDVIASTQAFSFGPRLLADLAGLELSPFVSYWAAALSLPAALATYCWGRAVVTVSIRSNKPQPPDTFETIVGVGAAALLYLLSAGVVLMLGPPFIRMLVSVLG